VRLFTCGENLLLVPDFVSRRTPNAVKLEA
jgi:hypothetical protein